MASPKKVNGYVTAFMKHQALVAKYNAKLEALEPLRRKMAAAHIKVKIKMQKMTGGELASAAKKIATVEMLDKMIAGKIPNPIKSTVTVHAERPNN